MKKSKVGCDLNSCMFCQLCLPEWKAAIAAKRQTYTLKKGEELFSEGDTVTSMFFVVEGTLKVHKRWGSEKELIVRFAKAGAIAGHRGLGDSKYPVSATAIETTTVCCVDLDFFFNSLKVNHNFLFELMMFFAEELQLSEKKMRDLAHMPVKGRLANSLLLLREKFGVTSDGFINIALSRQDLASYTGTTYETIFRVLNEFAEDGIVRSSEKNIAILNDELLRRVIQVG